MPDPLDLGAIHRRARLHRSHDETRWMAEVTMPAEDYAALVDEVRRLREACTEHLRDADVLQAALHRVSARAAGAYSVPSSSDEEV
jgi:hypothetical protein